MIVAHFDEKFTTVGGGAQWDHLQIFVQSLNKSQHYFTEIIMN